LLHIETYIVHLGYARQSPLLRFLGVFDKEGSRGESSANDGEEQNVEKGPEKVVVEQDKG
jgi:hypothetical protein